MKFFCDQQELIKNLNTVSKAVSSRTTIPTLKGILLELNNNILKMTASDMDITIEVTMDVEGKENGSVVIPAKKFIDYIRKLPEDKVEISSENNNVNIKCLSPSSSIVGMDAESFPVILYDEKDHEKLILNKNNLSNMIRKTSFAVSIDQTKGVLTGVLLEIKKDSIKTVAIDGFRMAINKSDEKSEKEERFIISGKIINEINKILNEMEDDEVTLYYDDKNALISIENVRISIRFIAGEFIKYEDIIPKDNNIKIEVNRPELINSVERASIMTEGKNNLIRVSCKEKILTISSSSEEGGAIEDILVHKDGDDIEIGFNARYLLDVLKVIEDEEIILNMNSPITPCVITPVDGDNYLYLVLPVRINTN